MVRLQGLEPPKNKYQIHRQIEIKNLSAFFITFKKEKIDIFHIAEEIDSSQTSGKLLISVLSAVAEIERENIIEQTMNGRREKQDREVGTAVLLRMDII